MKKGPLFEAQVVAWLRAHGFPWAERRVQGGKADKGDVAGVPGVVLELKNCAHLDLAGWLREAEQEAANAGVSVWAVVHKRRGVGDPAAQYVTLPLDVFARLLR